MTNSGNKENKKDFENELIHSLKSHGYLFPSTEKELEIFLSELPDIPLPEKFLDSLQVLNLKNKKPLVNPNIFKDRKVEQNLSRAAREGTNISPEVLKQMKIDRENSQNLKDE